MLKKFKFEFGKLMELFGEDGYVWKYYGEKIGIVKIISWWIWVKNYKVWNLISYLLVISDF